jgi:excisionase family DNA binding protein
MNDEIKDTCTVQEAAQLLGVSPDTIRRRIRLGVLHAQKRGKQYFINRAELEDFMHDNRKIHGNMIPDSWKSASIQEALQITTLETELKASQREIEMLRERVRELESDKAFLLDQIREKDRLISELTIRALPKPKPPFGERIRRIFRRKNNLPDRTR